eukprot:scaffold8531_cov62-Phaeocystis_antarctica.AAC.8
MDARHFQRGRACVVTECFEQQIDSSEPFRRSGGSPNGLSAQAHVPRVLSVPVRTHGRRAGLGHAAENGRQDGLCASARFARTHCPSVTVRADAGAGVRSGGWSVDPRQAQPRGRRVAYPRRRPAAESVAPHDTASGGAAGCAGDAGGGALVAAVEPAAAAPADRADRRAGGARARERLGAGIGA